MRANTVVCVFIVVFLKKLYVQYTTAMKKRIPWFVAGVYAACVSAYAVYTWIHSPTDDFQPAWAFFAISVIFVLFMATVVQKRLGRFHLLIAGIVMISALLARPATSIDYMNYLFGGALIHTQHISPYAITASELPANQYSQHFLDIWWSQNPSPYGPAWQLCMWFVNILSFNTVVAGFFLVKLLNLLGVGLAAYALWKLTKNQTLVYLFVINPVILENTIHTPHVDLWVAVGVLYALLSANTWRAGASIGLGGLFKIHGLMFAPFFMQKYFWKKILAGTVVFSIVIGVLWLLAPFTTQEMLRSNLLGSTSPFQDCSLVYLFLAKANNPGLVMQVALAVSGVLYAIILTLYYTQRLSRINAMFAAACLVPVFLTALVFPWHWLIVFALAYARNTRATPWWIAALTIGASMGPLPSFIMIISAFIFWYVHRFVRPQIVSVLQYGSHAKKIRTKIPNT